MATAKKAPIKASKEVTEKKPVVSENQQLKAAVMSTDFEVSLLRDDVNYLTRSIQTQTKGFDVLDVTLISLTACYLVLVGVRIGAALAAKRAA